MVLVGKFSGRLYPLEFLAKTHETMECLRVLTDEEYNDRNTREALTAITRECIDCLGCPYARKSGYSHCSTKSSSNKHQTRGGKSNG